MMFCKATLRLFLAVLTLSGSAAAGQVEDIDPRSPHIGSHVRGATPQINKLIARGVKGSKTFADLVAALNDSDVIVYIQITPDIPKGLDGRLAFMTSVGPLRYLHAQVRDGLGFEATIATAGHELQHALEVAADAGVRDAATLGTLYQRIGIRGVDHSRYDTTAARVAGRRVRQELS